MEDSSTVLGLGRTCLLLLPPRRPRRVGLTLDRLREVKRCHKSGARRLLVWIEEDKDLRKELVYMAAILENTSHPTGLFCVEIMSKIQDFPEISINTCCQAGARDT